MSRVRDGVWLNKLDSVMACAVFLRAEVIALAAADHYQTADPTCT